MSDRDVPWLAFDGDCGFCTTSATWVSERLHRRGGPNAELRPWQFTDLAALAAHADDLLTAQSGPTQFVTAALATLDTDTGVLRYVLAGHLPPLLLPRRPRLLLPRRQPPLLHRHQPPRLRQRQLPLLPAMLRKPTHRHRSASSRAPSPANCVRATRCRW